MEVIVGTYEHLILGYKLQVEDGVKESIVDILTELRCLSDLDNPSQLPVGEKHSFVLSFTNSSHVGAVKCSAISVKNILATGGSDESIQLFNLRKRKELGSLTHHNGSIIHLEFFEKSLLFSTSEDGTVAVWNSKTWECLRTLKHKDPVYCIAVHPSGKLALTTSKDRTLQTWNLVNGKRAFVTNLNKPGEIILFSPDGSMFVIVNGIDVDVYSTETTRSVHNFKSSFRISTAIFLTSNILAYAGEGGLVHIFNTNTKENSLLIDTNTTRVKGMAIGKVDQEHIELVTASSDGFIKLYQIKDTTSCDRSVCLVTEVNTEFRLLNVSVDMERCVDEVASSSTNKTRKRKKNHEKLESGEKKNAEDDEDVSKLSHDSKKLKKVGKEPSESEEILKTKKVENSSRKSPKSKLKKIKKIKKEGSQSEVMKRTEKGEDDSRKAHKSKLKKKQKVENVENGSAIKLKSKRRNDDHETLTPSQKSKLKKKKMSEKMLAKLINSKLKIREKNRGIRNLSATSPSSSMKKTQKKVEFDSTTAKSGKSKMKKRERS